MQVNVFVTHPFGTFKVAPRYTCETVEGALQLAFADMLDGMVSDCSVWIECDESRIVLRQHDNQTPWETLPRV